MEYKELFNKASYAAILCKKNRVKKNQINQLLSLFNSPFTENINDTIMLLMSFVCKQTMRRYFGKESSDTIISTLEQIKEDKNLDDKQKKKQVREYIGLLKWFFEVTDSIRVDWNTNENKAFENLKNDFIKWAK